MSMFDRGKYSDFKQDITAELEKQLKFQMDQEHARRDKLLEAQNNWITVAAQSNKDIDEYLKKIDPTLPDQYGMPLDGVKHVIRNLLNNLMEAYHPVNEEVKIELERLIAL